jgi:hypothetical protein
MCGKARLSYLAIQLKASVHLAYATINITRAAHQVCGPSDIDRCVDPVQRNFKLNCEIAQPSFLTDFWFQMV